MFSFPLLAGVLGSSQNGPGTPVPDEILAETGGFRIVAGQNQTITSSPDVDSIAPVVATGAATGGVLSQATALAKPHAIVDGGRAYLEFNNDTPGQWLQSSLAASAFNALHRSAGAHVLAILRPMRGQNNIVLATRIAGSGMTISLAAGFFAASIHNGATLVAQAVTGAAQMSSGVVAMIDVEHFDPHGITGQVNSNTKMRGAPSTSWGVDAPSGTFALGARPDGALDGDFDLVELFVALSPLNEEETERLRAYYAAEYSIPGTYPVSAGDPQLLIAEATPIYVVEGETIELWRRNVQSQAFRSTLTSGTLTIGDGAARRSWTMTAASVGTHSITLSAGGQSKTATVEVVPDFAGTESISILFCGDSITMGLTDSPQGGFVKRTFDDLTSRGVSVTEIGTQSTNGAQHEGHSGQNWEWFSNNAASPFFSTTARNFTAYGIANGVPDVVFWNLGTNDVAIGVSLGQTPTQIADAALADAEDIITAIRAQWPATKIVLGTPFPGRDDQTAAIRAALHTLTERYIEQFEGREVDNVFLLPTTHAQLDHTRIGYGGDAVHPTANGHTALARCFVHWLAAQFGPGAP